MYPNTQTKNPQAWNGSAVNGYPSQPPPPYSSSSNWNPQQGPPSALPRHDSVTSAPPRPIVPPKTGPSVPAPNPARMTEVKLYNNNRERETYDAMADLFSIIKTIDALEKAYVRDAISAEDYKKNCSKLLAQFKAAHNLTRDTVPDIKKFMQDYRIDNCKAAWKRIEEGMVDHEILPKQDIVNNARVVAETVQFFITAMDSLKLNMTDVDQIHPLLTDLLESLTKISTLSADWDGKVKIKNWLVQLNKMKASDQLNEEQIRQMLFDLESAYNAFHKSLSN